jgi:hypothetical protein
MISLPPRPPPFFTTSGPKKKTSPNFAKISLHSKLLLLSFSQINSAFSFQFSIVHHFFFFFFFFFPSRARTKPDDEATNSATSRNYTSSFVLLSLLTTAAAAITSTTTTTTRILQRILQKVSSCSATHFSGFLFGPSNPLHFLAKLPIKKPQNLNA